MKKMFTLFVALLTLHVSGLANPNGRQSSSLFLHFMQNADYQVTVNGMRYFDVRGQLAVHHLPPGNHRVRVVARTWRRSGRSTRNVFVQFVQVPFNSTVTARVHPFQGIQVTRVTPHQVRRQPVQRRHRNAPIRGGGRGDGYYRNPNRRGDGYYRNPGHRDFPNRQSDWNYRNPNQRDFQYRRGGSAMRTNNIDMTIRRMQDSGFDNDRLAIAKRHVRNNDVSSRDVSRMMRAMSFESNKLELAKFAYPFTIDPQNYEMVYDALSFSSSRRSLDQFLR
jgi:hypothetical protein